MAAAVASEHIPISSDFDEEMQEAVFAKRGCCFWMPCLGSSEYDDRSSGVRSSWWEKITAAEKSYHWWYKGLEAVKKVREWSELVAGPKWKTFIRRFNRQHRPATAKQGKFRYDPLSYSLNFDEGGQNGNLEDEDGVFRDFSSRFAMSAKSSMDLGKDGPAST